MAHNVMIANDWLTGPHGARSTTTARTTRSGPSQTMSDSMASRRGETRTSASVVRHLRRQRNLLAIIAIEPRLMRDGTVVAVAPAALQAHAAPTHEREAA